MKIKVVCKDDPDTEVKLYRVGNGLYTRAYAYQDVEE